MGRIIITLFYVTLFCASVFAQVKSEKVIVTKTGENEVELKAKLFGRFDDMDSLNNNQRLAYLLANYDVGFYVENYRALNWNAGAKTIGKVNRFRDGQGLKDTLVFSTILTNLPLGVEHDVYVFFKPKGQRYKFKLTGNEQIGDRLQDVACEPEEAIVSPKREFAVKNDTLTISVAYLIDENCPQSVDLDWEFRTYDQVIDTSYTYTLVDTVQVVDSTMYDTTYVYGDWKKWNSNRNGWVSQTNNDLTIAVKNKKWDRRQWRCKVYNNWGHDYSTRFTLRIEEEE